MRRVAFLSFLSSITLFAEGTKKIDESMPWMLPWLVSSLLMVGVVFWAIYKAMKTKNPKYGYVIAFAILLMVGMMFI